jgi:uncharacterized repeat protein (TIGR01451 family)
MVAYHDQLKGLQKTPEAKEKKMIRKRKVKLCILLLFAPLLICSGSKAWAQKENPEMSITIDVKKEVRLFKNEKWIVERVPVEKTQRDDILVYTITYNNEGTSEAKDTMIVDPVPKGTIFMLGSAEGKDAEIHYSIDGGHHFQRPPIKYIIRKPGGTREEISAPAEMYTHIKWLIRKSVLPGESGQLIFKAIVQ